MTRSPVCILSTHVTGWRFAVFIHFFVLPAPLAHSRLQRRYGLQCPRGLLLHLRLRLLPAPRPSPLCSRTPGLVLVSDTDALRRLRRCFHHFHQTAARLVAAVASRTVSWTVTRSTALQWLTLPMLM